MFHASQNETAFDEMSYRKMVSPTPLVRGCPAN